MMTSQALTCRDYESGVLSQCRLLVKHNPLTCTFSRSVLQLRLNKRDRGEVEKFVAADVARTFSPINH